MKIAFFVLLLASTAVMFPLHAQNNVLADVHLFQNFLFDAPISDAAYGEGGIAFSDYSGGNILDIGLQAGLPAGSNIEWGAAWRFTNISFGNTNSSGFGNLLVTGRTLLGRSSSTPLSIGGFVDLPVGSEDAGGGHVSFGVQGALRHALVGGTVLTATAGLQFVEVSTFRFNLFTNRFIEETEFDLLLALGGGAIFSLNSATAIVAEISLRTDREYFLISGGVDHKLGGGNRLRGGLGIGLDNGAPDVIISGGYLIEFN